MTAVTGPEAGRAPAHGAPRRRGAGAGGRPGAHRLVTTPPPAARPLDPDPRQARVVGHPGGPLLVLAGPGTGKTATLVEAVAERVRRGTRPEHVLVLTFSRKAAEELRDRAAARLGPAGAGVQAWTFHAWCLALVTEHAPGPPPRLLSGPERLVRVRELLRGAAAGEGSTRWPPALAAALTTRGMAREVADLLDRARERGLEPGDLQRLAEETGRDDWRAAAAFAAEHGAVLGSAGEMDYAELTRQALVLLEDPAVLARVRERTACVFVDEYQDTDPAQEELLRLLAGGGRDLVVVGDPDQSIYAFRGADVSCILRFPERFPTAAGEPAPVVALGTSRRAGDALLGVSRSVATRLPAPGLPADHLRAHRALRAAPGTPAGSAEVVLAATAADEAQLVADLLRRAHLADGTPWSRMAVLVRSGTRGTPALRRALVAAGVPVAVAADEVPVARDPAVAPLLTALRCAGDPSALDDERARALLLSPLVRATPSGLRRLGRALRAAERARLAAEDLLDPAPGGPRPPRPSAELLRRAVTEPATLVGLDERDDAAAAPARRLARLLDEARAALAEGGAPQALWALWDGSGWARRLQAASLAGGPAGRAADRDLDAVVALFAALDRLEERRPRGARVGVLLDELEAQEIPAEARSEGSLAAAPAVRLLTAHRSKGLEWDLVVVAGVQEGTWPDLRRRGSLLDGDRLSREGALPPPPTAALLADERRLFYTAVTRARRRLVVTAVRSSDEDGPRPSRFLDELGLPVPTTTARSAATLSPASVVARLRRLLLDGTTDEATRAAAAEQLARLARAGARGAHPDAWWGLSDVTPGAAPVRPADRPLALSASAVSAYDACPLAWFLEREVRAARPSTSAQGFGLALHVLARLVATGALPPEPEALEARLDAVWPALGFDAPWQADRERREAVAALGRLLTWHRATGPGRGRTWAASEAPFAVVLPGPDGDPGTLLRGSVDRVELDADRRAVVVDLKTGRTKPRGEDVATHAQLGVYQLVVAAGGLADVVGDAPPGGAELVHLRLGTRDGGPATQRQPPPEPDDDATTWAGRLVAGTAAGVRAEQFPARPGAGCARCAFRSSCPAQDDGGQVVP